jgi:hypothetical protein
VRISLFAKEVLTPDLGALVLKLAWPSVVLPLYAGPPPVLILDKPAISSVSMTTKYPNYLQNRPQERPGVPVTF